MGRTISIARQVSAPCLWACLMLFTVPTCETSAEFRPLLTTDALPTTRNNPDPQCAYRLRLGTTKSAQYFSLDSFNSTSHNGISRVDRFTMGLTPTQASVLLSAIFAAGLQHPEYAQLDGRSVYSAQEATLIIDTYSTMGWPTNFAISAKINGQAKWTYVIGRNPSNGNLSVLEQECMRVTSVSKGTPY